MISPQRIFLLLSFAFLLIGCDSEPPEALGPLLDEPPAGLRPEGARGVVPEDARIADYELEARLDAETHQVTGSARISWRNTSETAVDTVPFHLYMNGFRAEDTEWMLTSGGRHRRSQVGEEGAWGYIDVHSVRLESSSGEVVVEQDLEEPPGGMIDLEYAEDQDPSLMTVRLPAPIEPGQTARFHLAFTTQLPKVVARTGWGGADADFHAVAQWYPKIAVLEEDGWNAHTFTVNDEFFADFGNYSVTIDVPEGHIVGASGVRTSEEVVDGRKRMTYEAEMVHDFAWMSDPDFVEHHAEYKDIKVRQLIQADFVQDADAHMQAQLDAFKSYEERFGPYPWSTMTIIHVPEKARGAGGMEYPTLYTTSDRAQIAPWMRRWVIDERMSGIATTVHEFGHQYFQGLFASREHEQPWLDEGMNTFSNGLAMMDRHDDEDPWIARFFGHPIYYSDMMRASLLGRGTVQAVDLEARAYDRAISAYGATVYQKTSNLMMTLRNLVGEEDFDEAMRLYAERARFRQPRGEDLEATLIESLGETVVLGPSKSGEDVEIDLAHYFEQSLRTTRIVDFTLLRVRNQRLLGDAGWQRDEAGELIGGEAPEDFDADLEDLADEDVLGVMAIHRKGSFEIPVEIAVDFADGSEERFFWDGVETAAVFEWPGQKIRRVRVDPDGKIFLESGVLDNVAWANDVDDESDGLSEPVGRLAESLSLAVLGGIG